MAENKQRALDDSERRAVWEAARQLSAQRPGSPLPDLVKESAEAWRQLLAERGA